VWHHLPSLSPTTTRRFKKGIAHHPGSLFSPPPSPFRARHEHHFVPFYFLFAPIDRSNATAAIVEAEATVGRFIR
jgi:hypothetical protein